MKHSSPKIDKMIPAYVDRWFTEKPAIASELLHSMPSALERHTVREILDNICSVVVIKDLSSNILFINKYALDQLSPITNDDIIGHGEHIFLKPEVVELRRKLDIEAIHTGQYSRHEEHILLDLEGYEDHPEGCYFLTDRVPLFNEQGHVEAILTHSIDISERVRSEAQEALYSSVFKSVSEAIAVTNADYTMVTVNPVFSQITDRDESELTGKPINEVFKESVDAATYKKVGDGLKAHREWQGQVEFHKNHNETLNLQFSISSCLNDRDEVSNYVFLITDITEKKKQEQLIWQQANYCSLTSLPNRRLIYELLSHQIKASNRDLVPFSLMFIDLDNFKETNDSLGHQAGDEMLKEVATRLAGSIRNSDIVGRLGGDEFIVILPDTSAPEDLDNLAKHINETVSEPFDIGGKKAYTAASIGIAIFPKDGKKAEELLSRADQAMYVAKSEIYKNHHYFDQSLQDSVYRRASLSNEIRNASKENQFFLQYQPVVNLHTGIVSMAEAQLCWNHPSKGKISQEEFYPIAERLGLLQELDTLAFKTAANQVKVWRETIDKDFVVTIKKSPVYQNEADTAKSLVRYMKEIELSGSAIVMKFEERRITKRYDTANELIKIYQNGGIKVLVDNFGSGLSSIINIQDLHIDYFKVDESLTQPLMSKSRTLCLMEAIVAMAHKLEIQVIAQGVDNLEQVSTLKSIHCDLVQGNEFLYPLPAKEFEDYYKIHRRIL